MATWPVEEVFVAPSSDATAFGRRLAGAADRHPVVVDPAVGLPVLLRRDDHAHVFRDPETFSTRMFAGTVLDGALAALQGAEHRRMRRIYNRAFSGPALRRYEEAVVVPLARSLVAGLHERGEVDLVDDLAMALPRLILAELLEIPVEDIARYDDHVRTILAGVVRIGDPEAQATAHAAHAELLELIRAIVDRTSPTSPSLLGEIVGALEAAGDDDLREPVEQVVLSLLLGGFETTSWMLANALFALLDHPATLARVRREPSLAPIAVTEAIRWCPSVPGTIRLVERAVALGDVELEAGDVVFVAAAAAHYDRELHPEPHVFDIDRRPPATPMVFGGGVHHCVGMALSRMEARVAVETLLELAPDLRPAADLAPTFTYGVRGSPAHGPDRLPALLA